MTLLEFMDKYMHAEHNDLLAEAIPEMMKNLLLVMETAGAFGSPPSEETPLWIITWDRIDLFLPELRQEVSRSKTPVARVTHDAVPENSPQETAPQNSSSETSALETSSLTTVPEPTVHVAQQSVSEVVSEADPEAVPESVSNIVTEIVSETVSENPSEIVAETQVEAVPETVPEIVPEAVPEVAPEIAPKTVSERAPEGAPGAVLEAALEMVPEAVQEVEVETERGISARSSIDASFDIVANESNETNSNYNSSTSAVWSAPESNDASSFFDSLPPLAPEDSTATETIESAQNGCEKQMVSDNPLTCITNEFPILPIPVSPVQVQVQFP